MQLQRLFIKYGQVSSNLNEIMDSFRHRNKDIVFLVNVNPLSTQPDGILNPLRLEAVKDTLK
jgi:hypothetical protein